MADVIPMRLRRAVQPETATGDLRNALQVEQFARDGYARMDDDVTPEKLIRDMAAMRDRIVAALEKIEKVKEAALLAERVTTQSNRSIAIARVRAWL